MTALGQFVLLYVACQILMPIITLICALILGGVYFWFTPIERKLNDDLTTRE